MDKAITKKDIMYATQLHNEDWFKLHHIDIDEEMLAMRVIPLQKAESAIRLLKQKIWTGSSFIEHLTLLQQQELREIIDACFQLSDPTGIKDLPERCPSCGTPVKIRDFCADCAYDYQEAAQKKGERK